MPSMPLPQLMSLGRSSSARRRGEESTGRSQEQADGSRGNGNEAIASSVRRERESLSSYPITTSESAKDDDDEDDQHHSYHPNMTSTPSNSMLPDRSRRPAGALGTPPPFTLSHSHAAHVPGYLYQSSPSSPSSSSSRPSSLRGLAVQTKEDIVEIIKDEDEHASGAETGEGRTTSRRSRTPTKGDDDFSYDARAAASASGEKSQEQDGEVEEGISRRLNRLRMQEGAVRDSPTTTPAHVPLTNNSHHHHPSQPQAQAQTQAQAQAQRPLRSPLRRNQPPAPFPFPILSSSSSYSTTSSLGRQGSDEGDTSTLTSNSNHGSDDSEEQQRQRQHQSRPPPPQSLPPPRNRSRSRSSNSPDKYDFHRADHVPPPAPVSAFIDGSNARRLTRLYGQIDPQEPDAETTTTFTGMVSASSTPPASPARRMDSIPARTSSSQQQLLQLQQQQQQQQQNTPGSSSPYQRSTAQPNSSALRNLLSHKDSFGGDGLSQAGPRSQPLRKERSDASAANAFKLASIPQHDRDDDARSGSAHDDDDQDAITADTHLRGQTSMDTGRMAIASKGSPPSRSTRPTADLSRSQLPSRQPSLQPQQQPTSSTSVQRRGSGPSTVSSRNNTNPKVSSSASPIPTATTHKSASPLPAAPSPLTGGNTTTDSAAMMKTPASTMTTAEWSMHTASSDSPIPKPPLSATHPTFTGGDTPMMKSVGSTSLPTGDSNVKSLGMSSTSASTGNHTASSYHAGHSHRLTIPRLPRAPVSPAPPPSMYWSRAPIHGSVPRRVFRAHTATLCDDTMWLFGGCDSKGCFGSTWCFDVETMCWSKPRVNGDVPSPRRAHSATMIDRRLYVFGGGDGPQYYSDLYCFDTVSLKWSKPEVYGSEHPTPRRAHSANYWNGHIVIFGGGNGIGALADVWMLDVRSHTRLEWKKLTCTGKTPIGRGYHTGNIVDDKLIIIGGSDGHMSFNDIHILRLDTQVWYQVRTDEVHCRVGHSSTQVGSYLFVFGGHDSVGYSNEILTLNLVNLQWENRKVCGSKPKGRGYHQAWLCDSRLFVHAGFDGVQIFDDLYFLDLAACSYLPQITQFSVVLDEEEEDEDEIEDGQGAGDDIDDPNIPAENGEMGVGSTRLRSGSGISGLGITTEASPNASAIANGTTTQQHEGDGMTGGGGGGGGGLSGIVSGGGTRGTNTSGVVRRAV